MRNTYALWVASVNGIFLLTCLYYWQFSLDGPSHLYNGRIFSDLIKGDPFISTYYAINPSIVPNYFTSLLYLILFSFFDPLVAEKILIFTCLALIAFSSFKLISLIEGRYSSAAFLVLPFLFSFPLGLGFYNFLFGVGFLNLILYVILMLIKHPKIKYWVILCFLFGFLYLSHGFSFILSIGIGLLLFSFDYLRGGQLSRIRLQNCFFNCLKLLLVSSPGLLLVLVFLSGRFGEGSGNISFAEKIAFISELRPLVVYSDADRLYTRIYFFVYFALFSLACCKLIEKVEGITYGLLINKAKWLILFSLVLMAYFILPDQMAGGGFVSVRLLYILLFFGLFTITSQWFSSKVYHVAIGLLIIPFILYTNEKIQVHRNLKTSKDLIIEAGAKIPANSSVLPIYHGDNWLEAHISNLFGMDKPLLILENYEANTKYFPVTWKAPSPLTMHCPLPTNLQHQHNGILLVNEPAADTLDYLAFIGFPPPKGEKLQLFDSCRTNHELVFENALVKLFKLKYAK